MIFSKIQFIFKYYNLFKVTWQTFTIDIVLRKFGVVAAAFGIFWCCNMLLQVYIGGQCISVLF